MGAHSIHHVTAVTAQIARNMDYYTKTLGLRLVKRSVNQDDVSAYHLFYADAVGSPGTDMTFFDWPMSGANVPGAGTIALTTFRVPAGSLEWWKDRVGGAISTDAQGRDRLLFSDPEGQRLELINDTGMPGRAVPWTQEVPEEQAIRGILGVDLESLRPDDTRYVVTELLGFTPVAGDITAFETTGDSYGRLRVLEPSEGRRGRVGAGGVHHVAFRAKDDEELYSLMERIEATGLRTSGYVDRFYFHSIYFREPGGVLFEIATDGPGFAADEEAEALGQRLALPPFLEGQRERIEAGLKALPY